MLKPTAECSLFSHDLHDHLLTLKSRTYLGQISKSFLLSQSCSQAEQKIQREEIENVIQFQSLVLQTGFGTSNLTISSLTLKSKQWWGHFKDSILQHDFPKDGVFFKVHESGHVKQKHFLQAL